MTRVPDLNFARNRATGRRWRNIFLTLLCLAFGLQFGAAAWRWQAVDSKRADLESQHQQLPKKSGRTDSVDLPADQLKAALAAQAMLNSLAVPWEELLSAIEAARTQKILIDAVQPHAEDGSVVISVKCADFAAVAEFIERLAQQGTLQDVMLVSEARPENATSSLQAVISAKWRNPK